MVVAIYAIASKFKFSNKVCKALLAVAHSSMMPSYYHEDTPRVPADASHLANLSYHQHYHSVVLKSSLP